jgi:hypothetical protein
MASKEGAFRAAKELKMAVSFGKALPLPIDAQRSTWGDRKLHQCVCVTDTVIHRHLHDRITLLDHQRCRLNGFRRRIGAFRLPIHLEQIPAALWPLSLRGSVIGFIFGTVFSRHFNLARGHSLLHFVGKGIMWRRRNHPPELLEERSMFTRFHAEANDGCLAKRLGGWRGEAHPAPYRKPTVWAVSEQLHQSGS